MPISGADDPHSAPQTRASGGPRVSGGSTSGSHADEPTRVSDRSGAGSSSGLGTGGDGEQPTIEGYTLHAEIHRGGQGVVYRATQLSTKRAVALKVLLEGPFASEMARRRFEREIELAASLQHPHIVTILDSGISRGRYYFAMEFVEGERLDKHLDHRRPKLETTLSLLAEIAEAVNYAHQRGVIHRDLKPSNILIGADGHPAVLDFGLAKSSGKSDPMQTTVQMLSTSGQVIGTLAYMSPEQASGSPDVDVRSDVYSLGVIFYEALLGATPYAVAGSLREVLNRIANDEPTSPRAVRSVSRFGKQIDDELETILLKTLEKEPGRRYQTAGDLAQDLRRYLSGEPIEAKRASGLYMLRKTLRRYRYPAAAAAVLVLMMIGFLGVLGYQYRKERDLRAKAERLEHEAMELAKSERAAAEEADAARTRETEARLQAEKNERDAIDATERVRQALVRQMVQRGDLAHIGGDLAEARDSYWRAYLDGADNPASVWALRRYYAESGDAGAMQLFYRSFGPAALLPSGTLAAVCDGHRGISLRDALTGETRSWMPTPGDVTAIRVLDSGRVLAAGESWARVWDGTAPRPIANVEWTHALTPTWIDATADGATLFVADGEQLLGFRTDEVGEAGAAKFDAALSGSPSLSPDGQWVLAPMRDGVRVWHVAESGTLEDAAMWNLSAVRALRFFDGDQLAAVSDAVYTGAFAPPNEPEWARSAASLAGCNFLDVERGGRAILLGSCDGQALIVRNGQTERDWRIARGGEQTLQWDGGGPQTLSLHDDGALTHWSPTAYREWRRILGSAAVKWTISEDGSSLLGVDENGRAFFFNPKSDDRPAPIALPSFLEAFTGRQAEDMSLALDGTGSEALIQSGDRLWRRVMSRPRAMPVRGRVTDDATVRDIELSWDGQVAAFHLQSASRDRHIIRFQAFESGRPQRGRRGETDEPWRPLELFGSTVRKIGFLPHAYTLLVARSNGALIMLDPPLRDSPETTRQLTEPWVVLESPAHDFAFSRDGYRLALACDDGTVRIYSVLDMLETARINTGRRVDSVGFNATGTVLLVRTDDGTLDLYDTDEFERITSWSIPTGGATALATWIGDDDAIVVVDKDGVSELRLDAMDERIAKNELFAYQREVAARITDSDLAGAWQSADQLAFRDATLGREAKLAVFVAALRRPTYEIPGEWTMSVTDEATPAALLRIGHAAQSGGRFSLSAKWLTAARDTLGGEIDDLTAWRLAEASYLDRQFDAAADALLKLTSSAELSPVERARVRLELLAALVLSGRDDDARLLLARYQDSRGMADADETVGMMAALAIGNYLLGNVGDSQLSGTFQAFLTMFKEQWLDYSDDVEFFTGEMARMNGDLKEAASRYEMCIDVARDEWPANWARVRLSQLADAANNDKIPE